MCITWSHHSKYVICGCDCGKIVVLGVPDLLINYEIDKHINPITSVLFSANMTYFASSDTYGNVIIFSWPLCRVILYVKSSKQQAISFDWHPWKDNELIIGN